MDKKAIKSIFTCLILIFSFLTVFPISQADISTPHSMKGILYINDEIPTSPPSDLEQILVKLVFTTESYKDTIYEYNSNSDETNYNVGIFGHEGETADITVEYYGYEVIPDDNQTIFINAGTYGYIIDLHITLEIDIEEPSKVTGLSVTDAKDGKLDLSWDEATDNVAVDHYNIYRDSTFLTTTPGTTYQDTGLNNDQEYCYQISAVDTSDNEGEKSTQDCETPTKTTIQNNPPDKPTNPKPINNTEDICLNPELSVFVTDPDDDTLTVSFYNASNDQLIGTVNNVENASDATVIWYDLDFNTYYHWYAVASDGEETQSDEYVFKTIEEDNNKPSVNIEKPEEGSLYLFGDKIFQGILKIPFIIGSIEIVVNADDKESSISRVELSIKGFLCDVNESLTKHPYTYEWTGFAFGKYNITATAYDVSGNSATTSIIVRKFL